MQRLPVDVLQKLQQQGEVQDEAKGGRDRPEKDRDRGDDGAAEKGETTVSLTSEDSAYASSASSSSPLWNATGHARHQRPPLSRGGLGGFAGPALAPQVSLAVSPQKRPSFGSRASPSSPWSGSAETVPSQLLGWGAETDAGVLNTESYDTASGSISPPRMLQSRSAFSPGASPSRETNLSPAETLDTLALPSSSPSSASSGSQFQPPTPASQKSWTNTFGYLLRDNRVDNRLLKKSSKPSQHQQKSTTLGQKPAETRHSLSHHEPRIVEESTKRNQQTSPTSGWSSKSAATTTQSQLRHAKRPSLRKLQSGSPRYQSSVSIPTPPSKPISPYIKVQTPPFSPARSDAREIMQIRCDRSTYSSSRSRDSSRDRYAPQQGRQSAHSGPSSAAPTRWNDHLMTPPEIEPINPFESTTSRGDHYFRTFGADTVYQKAQPADSMPLQPGVSEYEHLTRKPARPDATRLHSDQSLLFKKNHRHGRTLDVFRKTSLPETHHTPSTPQSTPDITVSPPQLALSRRRSNHSSEFFTSYFVPHRRHKSSTELSPASSVSGLSTHWEDAAAESRLSGHVKEPSTPMSPFSMPLHTRRPRPKRSLPKAEDIPDTRQLPQDSITTVLLGGAVAGPQPKYTSADGEEYYKTSLTGPGALNFLPSEMTRVNTPPLKDSRVPAKKPTGFKNLFFDLRSAPTEETTTAESSMAPLRKRRTPIFHKASLQSLLPRLSLPKLKRKASQQIKEEEPPSPDPLIVIGFQQTPYNQRYNDARRAKINQIRSYVSEALNDDDDDSATMPFELNVPDHLPSSPLCPLHPKHKSGGKAICPIHRRKKAKVVQLTDRGRSKTQTPEPRIVYESEKAEDGYHGSLNAPGEKESRKF